MSLHANTYQVDPLLTGRRVELVFDPFDLTDIEVRYQQRTFGKAVAYQIGRHAHPKARPEQPDVGPPPPTGVDYLRLLDAAHQQQLAQRINYAALADADLDADGHSHPRLTSVLEDRPDPTPASDHDGHVHPEIPGQLTLAGPDPDREPA